MTKYVSKDGYICKKPTRSREKILSKLAGTKVYGVKARRILGYTNNKMKYAHLN